MSVTVPFSKTQFLDLLHALSIVLTWFSTIYNDRKASSSARKSYWLIGLSVYVISFQGLLLAAAAVSVVTVWVIFLVRCCNREWSCPEHDGEALACLAC